MSHIENLKIRGENAAFTAREIVSNVKKHPGKAVAVGAVAATLAGEALDSGSVHAAELQHSSDSSHTISNPFQSIQEHNNVTFETSEDQIDPQETGENPFDNAEFRETWERTDKPVADGVVSRTWMWGPQPNTQIIREPYAEAPGGFREVVYFDKSRMEITYPEGDMSTPWYVTNGLLAKELITGKMQTGDNSFEQRSSAEVNVAGDADDPNGPTYESFKNLLGPVAQDTSEKAILGTIHRDGIGGTDLKYEQYDVKNADYRPETGHNIAGPFWNFMNSEGPVVENGQLVEKDALFESFAFATGFPITEAFWTTVKVGGQEKDVLVQVFERRVLTYTPGNPEGWQVEAGNIGKHYYTWRYESEQQGCEIENLPFPKVIGNIEDDGNFETPDNLMITNDGCDIGIKNNEGDPERNVTEFSKYFDHFFPGVDFNIKYTDNKDDIRIGYDVNFDTKVPGAGPGKKNVIFDKQNNTFRYELFIPSTVNGQPFTPEQKRAMNELIVGDLIVQSWVTLKEEDWGDEYAGFLVKMVIQPTNNQNLNYPFTLETK